MYQKHMYISLNKRFLNPWFLDSLNPVFMNKISTLIFASFIRFPSITKYKLQCNCCYSFLCSFLLDLASCSPDTCFIFCNVSRWYAMFTSIIVFFNIPLLIWVYILIWHTSVLVTSKRIVITINRSKWNKTPIKVLWIWNDIIETPPSPQHQTNWRWNEHKKTPNLCMWNNLAILVAQNIWNVILHNRVTKCSSKIVNADIIRCKLTSLPIFSFLCVDIDECASDPCQNSGTCRDYVNRYNCTCVDGYGGEDCQAGKFNSVKDKRFHMYFIEINICILILPVLSMGFLCKV